MYGKIFESIFDGSLYGHWEAIITMQQLIVLADADGIVDMTPQAIAGKTSIPLEILEKGLSFLSEPDPHSRSPEADGVRIQLLDDQRSWGWFLVNHEKYKNLRTAEDRRKYMRNYMRDRRASDPVNSGKQSLGQLANKNKDKDKDKDKDENKDIPTKSLTDPDEFIEFKSVYPSRPGGHRWSRALKAILARLKEESQWSDILDGAKRYASYCDATAKTGGEYVMQAATFCGPDKQYLDLWQPPATKSESQQGQNIDAGLEFLGASNEQ